MNLIYMLVVAPLTAIIIGFFVAGLETVIQVWDEWSDRRKHRRELLREYDEWYGRYQNCDCFGGLEDKAKAEAVCLVLRHELKMLDGRTKHG